MKHPRDILVDDCSNEQGYRYDGNSCPLSAQQILVSSSPNVLQRAIAWPTRHHAEAYQLQAGRSVLIATLTYSSIRFETISNSGVYMILYSFCIVFISAFISYRIYHPHCVDKRPIRYEIISLG